MREVHFFWCIGMSLAFSVAFFVLYERESGIVGKGKCINDLILVMAL